MAITIVDEMAYLEAQLPFRAKAGPSVYSMADLRWDVIDLHYPHNSNFNDPRLYQDGDTQFDVALPLPVPIPVCDLGCDGYIYYLVTVAVDVGNNIAKAQNAGPVVVHAFFRPLDDRDVIPLDDVVSQRKLSGEGTPSEQKVVLGWMIYIRTFCVYLPMEKSHDWLHSLTLIVECGYTEAKPLEQIIGLLNHVGFILPAARNFINRLRYLHTRCVHYGRQHLNESEVEDVNLRTTIQIQVSNVGVSINTITFTRAQITL
jgi:hypothetical protein